MLASLFKSSNVFPSLFCPLKAFITSSVPFTMTAGTEDTNLNQYVNKKRSAGKVDMVVAIINAMYLLQHELLYNTFVVQY